MRESGFIPQSTGEMSSILGLRQVAISFRWKGKGNGVRVALVTKSSSPSPRFRNFPAMLLAGCAMTLASVPGVSAQEKVPVPEDLLEDEHFREEVGINPFTAPSIRKVFEQLAELGPIPFEQVKREVGNPPGDDRLGVALHLGGLIADGLLAVQCERYGEMEALGKGVLDHAELLGTGSHIKPHSKALLEHASLQQGEKLKEELAKTQRDIEKEMAELRDVDIAHLVSLGGWTRAFQVGCVTVGAKFSSENAAKLARSDIVTYYLAQLETLHPNLQARPQIVALKAELASLVEAIDIPEGRVIKAEEVAAWNKIADKMVAAIAKPKP